jgi:hypothetical protein
METQILEQSKWYKTDDNRIIQERHIRWVKKMDETLELCTKYNGCQVSVDTIIITKSKNPESYNRLSKLFE